MDTTFTSNALMSEQDKHITAAIARERGRLRNFIRRRIHDPGDAEDILQEVMIEFVDAYRLPESIEQVGAWLYRVARNRIIDLFRKKRKNGWRRHLMDPKMSFGWKNHCLQQLTGRKHFMRERC